MDNFSQEFLCAVAPSLSTCVPGYGYRVRPGDQGQCIQSGQAWAHISVPGSQKLCPDIQEVAKGTKNIARKKKKKVEIANSSHHFLDFLP